jgi:tetratricopeptide (TPR) repeat protein
MITAAIALPLAALGVGVAAYVVIKHWNDLQLLDPDSIKEEQERQSREALIKRRFDRLRADRVEPVKRLGRRLGQSIKKSYQRTYERLQAFEKLYQTAKQPFSTLTPSTRERVKTLLSEARSLMRDLKWADAERRYLEVLSLDTHQVEAYKGLGQIYLKQKLYPQAKETFEFVLKMRKADDVCYAALAEIAEASGDRAKAESMRLKAVEATPRQAFRHAELAQFYLAEQQSAKAWPSAKRASELEPQSAKYLELSLETAIVNGDLKEARQRFERLRLLSEDRSKFQQWRDRIEEMQTPSGRRTSKR